MRLLLRHTSIYLERRRRLYWVIFRGSSSPVSFTASGVVHLFRQISSVGSSQCCPMTTPHKDGDCHNPIGGHGASLHEFRIYDNDWG